MPIILQILGCSAGIVVDSLLYQASSNGFLLHFSWQLQDLDFNDSTFIEGSWLISLVLYYFDIY